MLDISNKDGAAVATSAPLNLSNTVRVAAETPARLNSSNTDGGVAATSALINLSNTDDVPFNDNYEDGGAVAISALFGLPNTDGEAAATSAPLSLTKTFESHSSSANDAEQGFKRQPEQWPWVEILFCATLFFFVELRSLCFSIKYITITAVVNVFLLVCMALILID